jgi:predicted CoA-substrate-specific enzyme activase
MDITTYLLDAPHQSGLGAVPAAGLDIGSRATKGALLVEGRLFTLQEASGVSAGETCRRILGLLLEAARISRADLEYLVGTGYGRVAFDSGGINAQTVTEISCHAMGAFVINPAVRTVIDIGGQDSKAIKVDPAGGKVIDFIMNDKCAAGTGRFLEKVAQLLELKLDHLGECAIGADNPAEISSQCVVFAESEIISLKARGVSRENIAAGIHLATARRIKTLLRKVGIEPVVLFSGGVVHNRGMRKALEEVLEITLAENPIDTTFAGAIGAAVYAGRFAAEAASSYGGNL